MAHSRTLKGYHNIYSYIQMNPLVPELILQCSVQKTHDLNGQHSVMLLADD